MNAISTADNTPAASGAQSQPEALLHPATTLLPWQQLSRLAPLVEKRHAARKLHPRLVLRGSRSYLRNLRAAEMAAWDAAGSMILPALHHTSRPIVRGAPPQSIFPP